MGNEELISKLENGNACIEHLKEMIGQSMGDYEYAEQRNADLSLSSAGLMEYFRRMPQHLFSEPGATVTKELLVSIYLMGRRDGQTVPSAFDEID